MNSIKLSGKIITVVVLMLLAGATVSTSAQKKVIKMEKKKAAVAKPTMIFVKGGTFKMGSNYGVSNEKPIHEVTVGDFYIGKYEVTQGEWEEVMGNNPSEYQGANRPVENVSWDDIREYIQKLNSKTGMNFRLPTEAEWEYAAKGGSKSKGYKYSGSNNIDKVAWCDTNSNKQTHEVGQKQSNELGIYDMTGNVWEWCSDWYDDNYYKKSPSNNPKGASSGEYRVLRGGSWHYNDLNCRSEVRGRFSPGSRDGSYGFRRAGCITPASGNYYSITKNPLRP